MPTSGPELIMPVDLLRLLGSGLDTKSDEPALVSGETHWTWRSLNDASDRYAAGLLALGLAPGDRVASLMPNRPALIIHYLACIKSGLVTTPLNYRYLAPQIDHALEVSGALVLLVHVERRSDLADSRLAGRLPFGVIEYGSAEDGATRFADLLDSACAGFAPASRDPHRPAAIFFTSGSTGEPKGVTHSAGTLGWLLASAAAGLELTENDVILPGSSMSHVGGYGLSMAALSAGARLVVAKTFDGEEILSLLRNHRPTVLSMLPAALFGLVRDHGAGREDFRSLRLCRSGGDKVSSELEQEFTALTGFPVEEGYGMTETGLVSNNPPSGLNKPGSVGRPMPGFAVSVRNDDVTEVPAGREGRLWVRARSNTVGYWNDDAATAELFRDVWLDTGDEMKLDSDGYLWFHGRKKQIIVHDGSNISPQEVEDAVLEHPAVEVAGVVGVHNLLHGENVRAYVTLKHGVVKPTAQEIIRLARSQIGYKAPEEVVFLDEIPINATGKVDRVALKKMAEVHLAGVDAS